MINYKVIKNLTNNYPNIDKEMFYRSLYSIYKNKEEIDLLQLGIPEHIYVSIFDLPLIEIKNGTIQDFYNVLKENFDDNSNVKVTELSTAIFTSINKFFILRKDKEFYFCYMHNNMFTFELKKTPMKNFIQFYRKQILMKLEI
jgi:hypothetical protein